MDQAHALQHLTFVRVLQCLAFEIVAWIHFKGAQPTWHYSVCDQPTWTPSEGDFPAWIFQGLASPLLLPSSLCCLHSRPISGASRNVGWKSQEKHNQSKVKVTRNIDERFGGEGIMVLNKFLKWFQILLIHNILDLIYQRKRIFPCSSQFKNMLKWVPFFYNQYANTHFPLSFPVVPSLILPSPKRFLHLLPSRWLLGLQHLTPSSIPLKPQLPAVTSVLLFAESSRCCQPLSCSASATFGAVGPSLFLETLFP